MKKTVFCAMVLCMLASAAVYADCENPRDDFDDLYCLNKIYVQADADLNEAYKKLVGKLDNQGRNILKKSQNVWIRERNSRCSFRDERGFFINIKCATNMTIERTNFLNDRHRECISSGCLNSKLE
ncbi:MAG: lysozyme inhibitor LprI family protein [Desulfococcaceae bacterium]